MVLLVIALAVSVTAAPAKRALQTDQPEAVLEVTKRDLGEVFRGEELEFTFAVRNAGTKALELKEKSSIPSNSGPSNTGSESYGLSSAMWRTGARVFVPVSALRAAPS